MSENQIKRNYWKQWEKDFILAYYDRFTDKQIADFIGRTESAVRTKKSLLLTHFHADSIASKITNHRKQQPKKRTKDNWEDLHISGEWYSPKQLTGWELETYLNLENGINRKMQRGL